MSTNIQRALLERKCYGAAINPYRPLGSNNFVQSIYGDEYIMSRMTLYKELVGHQGCVNTLYWSRAGDKLLSGSDDTRVCVWLPWEDYRMSYSIETGHRANIFSAKFMPQTSDSVIVTAAGDSEVRIFDVRESGANELRQVYTCHSDRVKRIALDDNPFEFLTCSEDGTVRHFDLREPHACTPHSVRSFLSASRQPARQYPRPQGKNVRDGCPAPLLDYGDYCIDINTLSVNKLYPQYFAVAGLDDYIYLHDRRMTGRGGGGAGANKNYAKKSRCVKRFTSTADRRRRHGKHVTACKFSDANGQELIGSWSSDAVYLFNMHDSPIPASDGTTLWQSSRVKRNKNDTNTNLRTSDMQLIMHYFRSGELDATQDRLNELLADINGNEEAAGSTSSSSNSRSNTDSDVDRKICRVWALCLLSAVHIRRSSRENSTLMETDSDSSSSIADEDLASARQYMQDAEKAAPRTWRALWCLAVGFWIACGGQRPNDFEDREAWLLKAEQYAARASRLFISEQRRFHKHQTGRSRELLSNTRHHHQQQQQQQQWSENMPPDDRMIDAFRKDVEAALFREGYRASASSSSSSRSSSSQAGAVEPLQRGWSVDRWKWLDKMYISSSDNAQNSSRSPKRPRRESGTDNEDTMQDESTTRCGTSVSSSSSSSSEEEESARETTTTTTTTTNSELQASEDVTMSERNGAEDRENESDEEYERVLIRFNHSNSDDDDDDDEEEQEDEVMGAVTRSSSSSEEYSGDDDSDAEDINTEHRTGALRLKSSLESDVDIVAHRAKYVGHCNSRTIKDVNFYGLQDEYIVSGSDDGFAFVWDKKTQKIVQILHGDGDTVNVIQGHPFIPVMAISGIDDTVKIFTPTSTIATTSRRREPNERTSYSESSHMFEMDRIVARNRESNRSVGSNAYITRSMLAAISQSLRNRQRRAAMGQILPGDENDEDDMPFECRVQ